MKRKDDWDTEGEAMTFNGSTPCGYHILAAKKKDDVKREMNAELSFMSEKFRMRIFFFNFNFC